MQKPIKKVKNKNTLDISKFLEDGKISTENILTYLQELSENINNTIDLIQSTTLDSDNKNKTISENIDIQDSNNIFLENALIISELDQKVILPYNLKDLKKILKKRHHKYKTIQAIIDDLYTVPLENYKSPMISRFKEAYKLIKEKEKGTFKEALSLALEVAPIYNLHPAVITACKNINEFDIYLSCLEYNELEDFHFFKIIFKAPPALLKNTSKLTKLFSLNTKKSTQSNI